MKRIVLILIVASVVMFGFVLKAPLRSVTNSIFPAAAEEAKSAAPQPPAEKKAAPRKAKAENNASAKSSSDRRQIQPVSLFEPAPLDAALAPRALDVESPRPLPQKAPAQSQLAANAARISGDSVEMYSINAPRGTILKILNKGEIVETDLELVDSGGKWTLVKLAEQDMYGFVRSDRLARPQTSKR